MEGRLQRKSILAVLIAMFLAFSIAGFAVIFNNNIAAAEDEKKPAETFYFSKKDNLDDEVNKIYYRKDFVLGWANVVEHAQAVYNADKDAYVKVILEEDWEAEQDSASGFGNIADHAYKNGSIYLPSNANIAIDLQGHKINRNLTAAKVGGHVFVIEGKLTIEDSSDNNAGVITGGYSLSSYSDTLNGANINVYGGGAAYLKGTGAVLNLKSGTITENKSSGTNVMGGAVYIYGGTFNMYDGILTKNTAAATSTVYGGAVCMYAGGTVNMYNGTISENINTSGAKSHIYGGAVCMYSGGTFNMHDGVIENNNASIGGGVAAFSVNGTAMNMYGGIIRNNKATIGLNTPHGGGGVAVQQGNARTTNVYLNGGEICNNNSTKYGGGVFAWAKNGTTNYNGLINVYINGTEIHDNIAATVDYDAVGGGVALYKTSSTYNNININAKMTSGKIYNNKIVANSSIGKLAFGAGIFVSNATFELDCEDGKESAICDNTAYSFPEDAKDSNNLSNISVSGYGGGIAVEGTIDNPGESHTIASKLIIKGGTIKNNEVGYSGGGIYLVGTFVYKDPEKKQFDAENSIYSKLELSGGEIIGNSGKYGGGLYVTGTSKLELSGKPVVKDNKNILTSTDGESADCNLQIAASDERVPVIGAFEDGALIHVSVNTKIVNDGTAFTNGYGKNNRTFVSFDGTDVPDNEENPTNGVWVYANPYRYFVSDTVFAANGSEVKTDIKIDQHIMVLANGELGISGKSIKFVVTYSDTDKEEFIFGDQAAAEFTKWNYTTCTYDETRFPQTITAFVGDQQVGETVYIQNETNVYTLKVKPDGVSTETEFHVVVQARTFSNKDLTPGGSETEGLKISLSGNEGLHFDGSEKKPTVDTIYYNGKLLVATQDYDVTYENNTAPGLNTAYVVITFKNNYSGTIKVPFSIGPDVATEVDVEWQVLVDSSWQTLTSDYKFTFSDTEDLSHNVRARLTLEIPDIENFEQTVYVQGYNSGDSLQKDGIYLVFKQDAQEATFKNVGTYSIDIVGYTTYTVAEEDSTISDIEIVAKELILSNEYLANIENYKDADGTRLWQLKIGTGEKVLYSTLLDTAIYTVDGQEDAVHGNTVDSYARFRNKELSLILNSNYKIEGQSLSYWIERATVAYTTNGTVDGTVVGEKGTVTTVTTVVTLTFDGNYTVTGANNNVIELTKTWYIITISNALRTEEGLDVDEAFADGEIEDITYSVVGVTHGFRPEHGNEVIYTYIKDSTVVKQFALVYVPYAGNPYYANKTFYQVKTVNGELAVDYDNPIDEYGASYLYTIRELKAGRYTLQLTIPQQEQSDEAHKHWWNSEEANDYGTMYYKVEYKFSFDVNVYEMVKDGVLSEDIQIVYETNNFVYYTGEKNNVVNPQIFLNGLLLVNGEDYELTSDSVNAGKADLVLEGINSLNGTVTIKEAYEILQAFNGWHQTPSIMQWTYFGYESDVNLFKSLAYFGAAWFEIVDAEGNAIEGLDHIEVDENGTVISTDVQAILKKLAAGNYQLLTHVEETTNYAGLNPKEIVFQVFTATNIWESKTVNRWIQGEYVSPEENLLFISAFGDVHIIITSDKDGKVYYDNFKGIDNLAEAKHGNYTLKAEVAGTSNYSGLDTFTFEFEIFKKPGLPWWATLLIAVGSLAVAALILFILWKKGVFQILTEKLFVAIKTRASVEATIASVRAAKMMEEGKRSVEEAKRKERLEMLRKKAQEEREMSPEERAAKLEAKAQADAERAEKLRKRSEAAQKRAEKLLNQESNTADGANDTPETPTEE